ncbi:hypothetical protein OAF24_04090 [bacterium]|nr:hypothetical protein [bacterium]
MKIGWYHYHIISSEGYYARTAFACSKCGVTHYLEHPININKPVDFNKPARYLYGNRVLSIVVLAGGREHCEFSDEPYKSDDHFTTFEEFKCPVCHTQGNVIVEGEYEIGASEQNCPLCGKQFECLGHWTT